MKILLINPNRYRTPPVPPLGLEYLENALRETHHECRILDLCFSDDPLLALEEGINSFNPDIAGVTVRNIDTVLFHNNAFFLDDIKILVDHLKKRSIPVILGGSGYSFIPEGGCYLRECSDHRTKGQPGHSQFKRVVKRGSVSCDPQHRKFCPYAESECAPADKYRPSISQHTA